LGLLNDALPPELRDEIGWVVSRTTDARRAADASVALDRLFAEREIQTLSQDERTFQTSFLATLSAILGAMDVVSIAIMGIMVLVLGNTISMGVRERTSEYGVLRALGFLPGHIAAFIFGEAVLIGAVGGGVGLAIAYPLVERGVGRWLEENMGSFFPYFRIDPTLAIFAVALAVLLGVAGAALPALRASRLTVTDALRRVA
jgi:putative ABC transport system permease protein